MQPPRTRYKVVERGRRLEVIDTWTGEPASRATRVPERAADRSAMIEALPAKLDQRGRRILRTRGWYDAKGPREIVLNAASEARLRSFRIIGLVLLGLAVLSGFVFWPILVFVGAFLLRGSPRAALRRGATGLIDSLQSASSGTGQSR